MAKAQILIVEDEEAAGESVKNVLEMYGYFTLGVARSGREAIARASAIRPDLALMDVGLDGELDGVETATTLRERFGVPCVFLTAHADEATLERAKAAAPLGYVLKPFEPRELRSIIEMALSRHHLELRLKASEERYHAVLEDMTELVCRFTPKGVLSYVNEAYRRSFGEGSPHWPADLPAADDGDSATQDPMTQLRYLTPAEPTTTLEQQTVLLDERVVWLQWTMRAIFDEKERLQEYQAVGRDISERVRAEQLLQRSYGDLERRVADRTAELSRLNEALRRQMEERKQAADALTVSNARLEQLLLSSPVVIYARSPRNACGLTFVSQNVVDLLGYEPAVFTDGSGFFAERLHPDDKDAAQFLLNCLSESGGWVHEYRFLHGDGRTLWIRDEARLVEDAEGQALEIVGTWIDITERVQAEEKVARHARVMTALYETSIEINTQPDVAALLQAVVNHAAEMLNADRGAVLLLEMGRSELELLVGYRLPPDLPGTRIPMGTGLVGRVAQSGRVEQAYDTHSWLGELNGEESLAVGRAIGVPLKVEGRVIGVLALGDRLDQGAFDDQDARVLGLFADQAAVAVEKSRLLQAERRQRLFAEALVEAAVAVNSTLDLDKVLDLILEQAERVIGGDTFNIMLVERSKARLARHRGYERLGLEALLPQDAMPVSEYPLFRRMQESDEPVVVSDTAADLNWVLPDRQEWRRSYVAAPIRVGSETVGFLNVNGSRPGQLGEVDGRRLKAFASYAGTAIENARLYEQARKDAETRRVLLREVNHRVKNNLAAIIGFLYAERRHSRIRDDAVYQDIMQDLVNRVQGMGTVHGMLSAVEWSPLLLSDLVRRVINSSLQMLPRTKSVHVSVDETDLRIPAEQAHNLALVINELATNTVKHALGERDEATIQVKIRRQGERVELEYRDDGPGYGDEVMQDESADFHVGFGVIRNIMQRNLAGRLELENRNGAVTRLIFRLGTGSLNG